MPNIPVPSNPIFTRSGDSVFENITIWGNANLNTLNVYGETLFYENVTFKKDIILDGLLDVDRLLVRTRLDVGIGGTALNIDTRTERVGIFTATPQQKFQFNSEDDNTFVITNGGRVGIGKTNPEFGIVGLNTAAQGELKLDVDGSISIARNIYDSAGAPGINGYYLNRDATGVRWIQASPVDQLGILVQDEGTYIPNPGTAQTFFALNFVQINSAGLGTDTIIPIPDPDNPTAIARIQSQDLWGYNEDNEIYRLSSVGIQQDQPGATLDVNGTLNVDGATTLNSTLDVDGATTINDALDVDGATTLRSTLNVDLDTTLNNTLDVDGDTTLNSTLDVDGGTTLNSTLDVDGGTTLNSTLDVDGVATFNDTTDATSKTSASVQIDGGVGIVKKLFVGSDTKIEGTTESTDKDTGALVVEGGVGIEKNLNVGINAKIIGTLELDNSLIDVNQQTGVGVAKTDYRLASVGTGVSWRPSGVETHNTIWVSKNGIDSNSGLLEGDAKATVGGAAAIAQPGDTIKIRPGRYIENNPVGLQRDVSITGEDIRLVTIEPSNTSLDVFWVRRGCLVENLNFSGATVGVSHAGGSAVAFPKTGVTANSGYTPAGPATQGPTNRWRSPYIRNCTNFMTESIGMRIDGDDAIGSPDGANLKSMVCDSFTQYNENGIGVSLTNNAYAQLVSIFTINNDIGIYADTGGQCDLTNSNSSFGNFGLFAVGLGATQYTGTVLNNVLPGDDSDTVVGTGVTDAENQPERPFDGQALYFKIDLDNYPDAVGSGRITAPLQEVFEINILDGVSGGPYSQSNPPDILIRDADQTVAPKGPQGIVAEGSATINVEGTLTAIDIVNSGRNYLPTQNIVVEVNGDTSVAEVVMKPLYFTISEATENTTGITTMTFNEFVPYELFAGDPFTLQRISRILTSSHSFEYVGSGTSINTSLPFEGAVPIKANEVVALDGAQIPFTSTDQKGNFDIGEGIQVDQTTSTIRGRDFSKAIQAEVTPLILALR